MSSRGVVLIVVGALFMFALGAGWAESERRKAPDSADLCWCERSPEAP